MDRAAFLARLRPALADLPTDEIDEIIADYETHFAEAQTAGRTDSDTAMALGDPDRLAKDIKAEMGVRRLEQKPRSGNVVQWTIIGALAVSACFAAAILLGQNPLAFAAQRDQTVIERELPWTPGDELTIDVDAQVTFQKGPDAQARITGPAYAVAMLSFENERITYNGDVRERAPLHITLIAPSAPHIIVNHAASVSVIGVDQAWLAVCLNGGGPVQIAGDAQEAAITVHGPGQADLSALRVESVRLRVVGDGAVRAAPTEAANISIRGAGTVDLLVRPEELITSVVGTGRINTPGRSR